MVNKVPTKLPPSHCLQPEGTEFDRDNIGTLDKKVEVRVREGEVMDNENGRLVKHRRFTSLRDEYLTLRDPKDGAPVVHGVVRQSVGGEKGVTDIIVPYDKDKVLS